MKVKAKDYHNQITAIQEDYLDLNLTFEQAELVFRFEQEQAGRPVGPRFSKWEKLDYEYAVFSQFLTPAQRSIYEENQEELRENYQQNLIEEDLGYQDQVKFTTELVQYYENELLPILLKNKRLLLTLKNVPEKAKIEFLKSEYRHFLTRRHQEILVNHFRFNRIYQPNFLKYTLLEHRLLYLYPNFQAFKKSLDPPTKAVAQFLKERLSFILREHAAFMQEILAARDAFSEQLATRYFGAIPAQNPAEQLPAREEEEINLMNLLLLDKKQYA